MPKYRRCHVLALMVAMTVAPSAAQSASSIDTVQMAQTNSNSTVQKGTTMQSNTYVGMWVTADGRIRQELLPNGRYDEARGTRRSAYQGRYEIKGNEIDYWDDTGFTADGTFVSKDELHHGGMVFFREK